MEPLKELLARLPPIDGCLKAQRTTSARRRYPESEDEDIILGTLDPFLVDCERKIVPSQAHRRLFGKTQVLSGSLHPHIRTRITHTGEVVAVSSTTAAILGISVELVKAIALSHDTGHPPLGKPGEKALREVTERPFKHEMFGVVIAQHIEQGGKGLNLTHETLTGILEHSRGKERLETSNSMSAESATVMACDKIAYIVGDYEDAIQVGLPLPEKLTLLMGKLGKTAKERTNRLIAAACLESAEQGHLSFVKSETAILFQEIRRLMYEEVYPRMDLHDSQNIVERIYTFIKRVVGNKVDPVVAFALLTDQEVIQLASQHVLDVTSLTHTGMWDILPTIEGRIIEWWNADLDW